MTWPPGATPFGMGGGGAMFQPTWSPHDDQTLFVQCDMGGLYRSRDGGMSWRLLPGRSFRAVPCEGCPPVAFAFHPKDPNVLVAFGEQRGEEQLLLSRDGGDTFEPWARGAPWTGKSVTAFAFDPADPMRALVGTTEGAYVATVHVGSDVGGDLGGGDGGVRSATTLPTSSPEAPRAHVVDVAVVGATWVVAAEEGVFVSSDGGRSFALRRGGLPDRAVRRFAAGTSPEGVVLYVTVESRDVGGRFEGGVYRSRDLGATWSGVMGGGINTSLGKKHEDAPEAVPQYTFLAVVPGDARTVYVASRGNGLAPPEDSTLWRSRDAGTTWTEVLVGDPRLGKGLAGGLGSLGGPRRNVTAGWITWDYGWWWGGDAYGLGVSSRGAGRLAYVNLGELFVSEDGADTWRQRYTQLEGDGEGQTLTGRAWRTRGLDVTTSWHVVASPHDPSVRFVTHSDIGLTRSEDGGRTWRHALKGSPWTNSVYALAFDPDDKARVYAAASRHHDLPHWRELEGPRGGGGVIRSDDGGRTWASRSKGLPEGPAVGVVTGKMPGASRPTLWAALFGHGVYRSDDDGASWRDASSGLPPANRHLWDLQRVDGALYVAVTGKRVGKALVAGGGVFRSDDGGAAWRAVTDPQAVPVDWVQGYAVSDGGRTLRVAAAATSATDEGAAESRGGLYTSSDGGKTWRKEPVPFEGRPVEAFAPAVHPGRPGVVFVTSNGQGTFWSHDGGKTFQELPVPFRSTHRVEVLPDDEEGVYVSTFGGGTWRVALPPLTALPGAPPAAR